MAHATVRILGLHDLDLLCATPEGLFDKPVDPEQARAFLGDAGHLVAAAIEDGTIVSFATGTVLLHPDKRPALFVNEVGTREDRRRRGLAALVTQCLVDEARARGYRGAWVATEADNAAARALYRKLEARETDGMVVYDWDDA
jgi:ribosomal protein S18 acetylase RimI-like enzyme